MFKVIGSRESKEMGHWDIESVKTGEIVAYISTYYGFSRSTKQLKVKDKVVCSVKNHDEAIVRLIEFFAENERQIEELRKVHDSLAQDLFLVKGQRTHELTLKEIKVVEKKIKELEEYKI